MQLTIDKQKGLQARSFVKRGNFEFTKVGSCYMADFDLWWSTLSGTFLWKWDRLADQEETVALAAELDTALQI